MKSGANGSGCATLLEGTCRRILQGMPLASTAAPVVHVEFGACDPAGQAIGRHGSLSSLVSMWASPDAKHGGHWNSGVGSMPTKITATRIHQCGLHHHLFLGLHASCIAQYDPTLRDQSVRYIRLMARDPVGRART